MARQHCTDTSTTGRPTYPWTHGREQCPTCHGWIIPTRTGKLRNHVPGSNGTHVYSEAEVAKRYAQHDRELREEIAERTQEGQVGRILEERGKAMIARNRGIDVDHCSGCEDTVRVEWLRLIGEYDD